MAEAKQYANKILDLQSTQVFCGLSYIATAKNAINITLHPSLLISNFRRHERSVHLNGKSNLFAISVYISVYFLFRLFFGVVRKRGRWTGL